MRRRAVAFAVAAIACGGADEPAAAEPSASYGRPFSLAVGESARVEGALRVTFARLVDDPACAEDEACAGRPAGAAVLALSGPAGRATLTLPSGRDPRRVSAAGHTVEVVQLRPDTVVTLRVTPSR